MRLTGAAPEIYLSGPFTESAGACSYQLMDGSIWGFSVAGVSPWASSLMAVDLPQMAGLYVRRHPSLSAAVTVCPFVRVGMRLWYQVYRRSTGALVGRCQIDEFASPASPRGELVFSGFRPGSKQVGYPTLASATAPGWSSASDRVPRYCVVISAGVHRAEAVGVSVGGPSGFYVRGRRVGRLRGVWFSYLAPAARV